VLCEVASRRAADAGRGAKAEREDTSVREQERRLRLAAGKHSACSWKGESGEVGVWSVAGEDAEHARIAYWAW
jgi:hypothetical protein